MDEEEENGDGSAAAPGLQNVTLPATLVIKTEVEDLPEDFNTDPVTESPVIESNDNYSSFETVYIKTEAVEEDSTDISREQSSDLTSKICGDAGASPSQLCKFDSNSDVEATTPVKLENDQTSFITCDRSGSSNSLKTSGEEISEVIRLDVFLFLNEFEKW